MTKKKTVLIPAVLIFTVLILLMTPITVHAESSDNSTSYTYQPRLTAPDSSNPYYSSKLNYYFATGYGMPNCVAYAYGRIYEINGEKPKITHGSACDWYSMNKSNGYYPYGSQPKVGAVACWSHHVAVVEKINDDGSITFSESRWQAEYFVVVTYKNPAAHNNQKFYGYIYTYDEEKAAANAEKAKKEALGEKLANAKEEKNTVYKQEKITTPDAGNQFSILKPDTDPEISFNLNLLSDKLNRDA